MLTLTVTMVTTLVTLLVQYNTLHNYIFRFKFCLLPVVIEEGNYNTPYNSDIISEEN